MNKKIADQFTRELISVTTVFNSQCLYPKHEFRNVSSFTTISDENRSCLAGRISGTNGFFSLIEPDIFNDSLFEILTET